MIRKCVFSIKYEPCSYFRQRLTKMTSCSSPGKPAVCLARRMRTLPVSRRHLSVGTPQPRLLGSFASVWGGQAGAATEESQESSGDSATLEFWLHLICVMGGSGPRPEISTHHRSRAAAVHLDALRWVQSAAQPIGLTHRCLLVFI